MSNLFEYALLRVVPRPEREEFINVGVILYCPGTRFLDCRFHLDKDRLYCFAPNLNYEAVVSHLEAVRCVCAGGSGAGALGSLRPRERFGRLVAPRSTVVQPSPVHTGFSDDPDRELERLLKMMVLPPDGPY